MTIHELIQVLQDVTDQGKPVILFDKDKNIIYITGIAEKLLTSLQKYFSGRFWSNVIIFPCGCAIGRNMFSPRNILSFNICSEHALAYQVQSEALAQAITAIAEKDNNA